MQVVLDGHALAAGIERVLRERLAKRRNGHALRCLRQAGALRKLNHKAAVRGVEQGLLGELGAHAQANEVAHAHLEHGLGHAAVTRRAHRARGAGANELLDVVKRGEKGLRRGRDAIVGVLRDHNNHLVVGVLELRRGHAVDLAQAGGKRDQRGRHVEVLERAGHGVLAANGANAQVKLGHKRAEKSGRGPAPALGVVAELLEVLLEREIEVLVLEAHGNELGDGLNDGQVGAGVLVLAHEVGVVAPRHARARGGLAVHGELCRHAKRRRELRCATKRHEDGRGANG